MYAEFKPSPRNNPNTMSICTLKFNGGTRIMITLPIEYGARNAARYRLLVGMGKDSGRFRLVRDDKGPIVAKEPRKGRRQQIYLFCPQPCSTMKFNAEFQIDGQSLNFTGLPDELVTLLQAGSEQPPKARAYEDATPDDAKEIAAGLAAVRKRK